MFFSCEDNRLNGLEPDKVYLSRHGIIEESVFDLGEDVIVDLWANKSGIKGTSATVIFSVDEQVLTDFAAKYDTLYSLLPENQYRILNGTSFYLSGDEQYAKFRFSYNPAAIVHELYAGEYEKTQYALPVKITVETGEVDITDEMEDGGYAIIVFRIKKPVINIRQTDFQELAVTAGETGTENITVPVELDFASKWDLQFGFSTDEQTLSDAVAEYNAANGVNYTLLPPEAYSMLTENPALPVGQQVAEVSFVIRKEQVPLGNYVLPFVLNRVTEPIQIGNNNKAFVVVKAVAERLDRTGWTATARTHDGAYPPEKVLDGDETDGNVSYWHVSYKAALGNCADLDPWLKIEMPEAKTVGQVEIYPRYAGMISNNALHVQGYEIFTSDTGGDGTWTKQAEIRCPNTTRMVLIDIPMIETRFVKIGVLSDGKLSQQCGAGNTVGIMEIYLRGY
jgi:hypothetical protein